MNAAVQTQDRIWNILVHGYGCFQIVGSREQAEKAKADKCHWERASGRLWPENPLTKIEEIEAEIGIEFRDRGSCPMATLNRLRAAKQEAA